MLRPIFGLVLVLGACNGRTPPDPSPGDPSPGASPAPPAPATDVVAPEKAEIGKPAPAFALTDLSGKQHRLADYRGKIVVLEWFNPECPFVRQSHEGGTLDGLAPRFTDKGVVWLAINSGAPGKQGAGKQLNEEAKKRFEIDYPILLDESGRVGKAYGAMRTPHMYVIDREGLLVYRGAIDNTNGGDREDIREVENYVASAVADVEAKRPVRNAETRAFGCTVKYSQ